MSFAGEVASAWASPPAIFRGAPFWSWNGLLDPDRLRRAIRSMHEAGLGGFFMHSRYGLKTPYLSDEWFRCVSACVEQARKLGMKAYLYDEDRWPSGAAGGLVTRDNEEYRAKLLVASPPDESDSGEHVAIFAVRLNADGALADWEAIEDASHAPAGSKVITFNVRPQGPAGWYNDGTYLDTMNPDAVAEFIRVTHRAYADRFGKDFGQLVPAIFTDEPNVPWAWSIPEKAEFAIPWTTDLPRQFKRRRGYDIRDHLPLLVLPQADRQKFSRVRYDYFRTITELFVESFTTQVGLWCAKQPIALTGHVLGEETLANQIRCVGAAMPHYEQMQWPGIDVLCDQADELSTAKQCSSVADQLARPRVLSEMYGCTGWDWPLEGHKFVGDWQYAAGVNFRCPHLTHYSLAGGAKRDYPASIFNHSPWWKYYSTVEDYFARLSVVLTQGVPLRDVLVIHPVESAWGLFRPGAEKQSEAFGALEETWRQVIYDLSGEHYDWDFGDESLLERHAKVSGPAMKVGRMTYRVVVVPAARTLRAATLALLGRFAAGGGKLLFVGHVPGHVDAQPSDEVCGLVEAGHARAEAVDRLAPALEGILPRRVSITEDGRRQFTKVWAMLRRVKGGQVLFIQSHDRAAARRLKVDVLGRRPVVLWDARTGDRVRVRSEVEGQRVRFELELAPTGSALLTLGVSVPEAVHPPHERKVVERRELAGPFEIELEEPNCLPLDYCSYSFGGEEFSAPMPTLRADTEIRKRFGLGSRLGAEQQPWYLYATGVVDTAPRGRCRMRRLLHVTDPPASCALAIEQPEDFRITVNGRPVGGVSGWWIDEDIKTVDLSGALRAGENEIMLEFDYRPDMELEDLYLVGDFAVATLADSPAAPGNVTVTRPATALELGSWVGQGLDFYGGSVHYKVRLDKPGAGRRLRVSLPGVRCTAAAVHVGGRTFVLPWAPFEADITDAMADGANDVAIEVIGGRKNILGPLHVPWGRLTGPGQFSPDNRAWTDEYQLTDHGLTAPILVETLA